MLEGVILYGAGGQLCIILEDITLHYTREQFCTVLEGVNLALFMKVIYNSDIVRKYNFI